MSISLWEVVQSRFEMWLILGMSILAIAVALERMYFQWRYLDRARSLGDTVTRCLTRGALDEGRSACERSQSPLADVFLVGYERYGRSRKANMESAVRRERVRVTSNLSNWMWVLGTIGATAPFVGLFGTVLGVMEAFDKIKGTEGTLITVVAPGISVALYATAAGILVAVEAVVIYNYFNQRSTRISREMKMLTDEFIELLDEMHPEAGGSRQSAPSESGENDKEIDRGKSHGAREAA